MKIRSVQRKIVRTPEEIASLRAFRERMQRERPTLDDLQTSGEYVPFGPLGALLNYYQLLHALKLARKKAGLSLAVVSQRSGIDRAALSRLENGRQSNPTVSTLYRYAAALGKELVWSVANLRRSKTKHLVSSKR